MSQENPEPNPELEAGIDKQVALINFLPSPTFGDQIRSLGEQYGSLVIIATAHGTMQEDAVAAVGEVVQAGKPVFILPDNPGRDTGIRAIFDQPQIELLNNGAHYPEAANVNNAPEFASYVQEKLKDGLTGDELVQDVLDEYALPADTPDPDYTVGEHMRQFDQQAEEHGFFVTDPRDGVDPSTFGDSRPEILPRRNPHDPAA